MTLLRERGDRLRADRAHHDDGRLGGQRGGRAAVAEQGLRRLRAVGDHEHERIGVLGRGGRRARGARTELVRGRAGPLRVDVEDGELEPGRGEVARHRAAHGAEADEAEALHRRSQPSSASLAPTASATASITASPSPCRSSAPARGPDAGSSAPK